MSKGGCYCGNIRFEVKGDIRPVVYCHCGQCRKISGHFMAASAAKTSNLNIFGDVKWFRSSQTARRGFCPDCGTHLFWRMDGEENTSIDAGAFNDDIKLVAQKHIYVERKADYYEINDGLPQFDAMCVQVK